MRTSLLAGIVAGLTLAACDSATDPAAPPQQALSAAQSQAALANAYGPMGFGGQTAYHAGLGAAYGRNTGGFNARTAESEL